MDRWAQQQQALVFGIVVWILRLFAVTGGHTICKWETFNATCGPGHVIAIEAALYGRMQLGRCVDRDYGYIGCQADVRPYLDRRCSGRRECSVSLPDSVLDKTPRECPMDLGAYLEASYTCVRVLTAGEGRARCRGPLLAPAVGGFISNQVTMETGAGSTACPWRIEGGKGQKVSLSLLDFAVWHEGLPDGAGPPEKSGICHIYAQVREPRTRSSITLCGGEAREKEFYTSEGSVVEVEVINNRDAKQPAFFMLKYQVSGCPDYVPPPNALAERTANTMTVHCAHSDVTWHLTCRDEQWVGAVANCTADEQSWNIAQLIENTISLPQGLLIVIIIAIAVFIALIILVIGILALRRRTRSAAAPAEVDVAHYNAMHSKYGRDGAPYYGPPGKEQYPMLNKEHPPSSRESDYTTTLHRRLAVPPPPQLVNGGLPELPPPPPPDLCPVHGGYADGCLTGTGPGMHTFRPPQVEHIYESPKFERKRGPQESPFYHELEPTLNSDPSSSDGESVPEPPDPTQLPRGLQTRKV